MGTLSEEYVKGAKAANNDMDARLFSTREELIPQLSDLLKQGDSILIKASHFMHFEKIIEALED